jgi:hypothetical protein
MALGSFGAEAWGAAASARHTALVAKRIAAASATVVKYLMDLDPP